MKFLLALCFGLLTSGTLAAQEASEKINPYQHVAEQFANALNTRDIDAVIAQMDLQRFARTISKQVFEASDEKNRQSFENGVMKSMRTTTLQSWFHALDQSDGRADFLRVIKVGAQRRSVVRLDFGDNGVNYLELLIDPRQGKIVDVLPHSSGQLLTDSVVAVAVLAMPDSGNLITRVLGVRQPDKAVLGILKQVSNANRQGQFGEAYKALLKLPVDLQKTRVISVLRLNLATSMGEPIYSRELDKLAADFGHEPELALMLIDYHLNQQQYDKGLEAIATMEARIGPDALLSVLKATLAMQQQAHAKAADFAREAVQLEPARQDSHWLLLTNLLRGEQYEAAAEQLDAIAERFQLAYSPDELEDNAEYHGFVQSPAFQAWRVKWDQ